MILKNLKLCSTLDVVEKWYIKECKIVYQADYFYLWMFVVIFKECFLSLILFKPFSVDIKLKIL